MANAFETNAMQILSFIHSYMLKMRIEKENKTDTDE